MIALALALGLAVSTPGPDPARERPNLVVFLIDDLGWQDLSEPFHTEATPFNGRYHTPHVEGLAQRGVKFTQAYASAPVCSPTRTSLLTGMSPARSRITYWILHADKDQSAEYPGAEAPPWNVNGLQPGDVTLPGLLREAGYRTLHVGKAHFGAKGTPGEDPTNLGFDANVAGHGAGGPGSFLGTQDFSAAHRNGGHVWDVPDLEEYHGEDVYLTEALAAEACELVSTAVADDVPFFLHFAPYAVHAPITANECYLERYAELDEREAAYATMIETMDAAIGSILDELEELGVADETIVVFTSDNGGLSAHARGGEKHTHNAPLRSGKGSAYEGGVRVPWIVAWPGVTDEAGTCTEPVVTHDLFPTLLAWAEVEIPAEYAALVDGRDLTSLVRGANELPEERVLVWHQPHFWGVDGPGIWPFSSIRAGDWKLLYRHAEGTIELYDLGNDLGETHELAAEHPERARELALLLEAELARRGAQMSLDPATGDPLPLPGSSFR